jgi:hypothetical protein
MKRLSSLMRHAPQLLPTVVSTASLRHPNADCLKQRMQVYVPTAAELRAFRQASEPAVKAYIQNSFGAEGSELLDALSAAIEAANN